jgi:chromosome segregation ATPase
MSEVSGLRFDFEEKEKSF